jgi:MSHA biogenesis protein MshG
MPMFAYRARTAQGDLLQGVIESSDTNAVATYLFNIGSVPVEIKPSKKVDLSQQPNWWQKISEKPVTSVELQLFTRQLHTLLKSGVPLMRGLAGLQESAINRSFARVLKGLRDSLDMGRELSAAMRNYPKVFSGYYISMIQVGELTGKMNEILPQLHDYIDSDRSTREQVKAALRYPKFVVMAMIAAMVIINVFVLPAFIKVFERSKAELPLMTRILMTTSHLFTQNWPLILAAVVIGFVGVRSYLGTENGRYRWDKWKLRMPIVGDIVMKGTMSRFARSYSLAYRSGIPVAQTLSIVARTVDNAFVARRIEQIRDGVERGETILRTASTTGVFSSVALQMIAVGEETGEIDKLMDEIADMYEREVQYEIKTLAARIEPIMIILMALMVLVLALGVFMPMWNLSRAVKGS